MIRAKLTTRAGDLVTHVEIPRMSPPADALVWGDRFFVLVDRASDEPVYVEGICWVVSWSRALMA